MGTDSFRFRQFLVRHDRSSMRVGTDGVLLGAWAPLPSPPARGEAPCRILDVGTGSGLIALIAAQRAPHAQVWGVDVDGPSVQQARENFEASPFAARLCAVEGDFLMYEPSERFDSILSNPPFFTEDTLSPSPRRAAARSASALPTERLVEHAARLLVEGGSLSLVVPAGCAVDVVEACCRVGLSLTSRLLVRSVARRPPMRALLSFVLGPCGPAREEELILMADGHRSSQYQALTEALYL